MEQLETIKGKSVTIPKLVNRYLIMHYDIRIGWQANSTVYTTPESAIQSFLDFNSQYKSDHIKYYKVVEVELEIPFIPNETK